MEKLRKWLEAWYSGKTVRGIIITPVDIYQLADIYEGKQTEFISQTIHDVLEKCGIKIREKGIGWVIC